MDNYGNLLSDDSEQWAYSMNTFGLFDNTALDICWNDGWNCVDYAAQEI